MAGKTTIEWTAMPGFAPAVWNPTTGCTRVSAGCDNCYAFALHDKRFATNLKAAKDAGAHRMTVIAQLTNPETIILRARTLGVKLPWPKQYDLPFSRVQLLEDRLDAPLRTKKPTCYFVDSMADLFHSNVPDAFLDRVFLTMAKADRHRFLVLTKRPERMPTYLEHFYDDVCYEESGCPVSEDQMRHVWLGTSVEDQASFNERMPHLRATPAAIRFLSIEPLLGPLGTQYSEWQGEWVMEPSPVQWVIVGGESGSRARPFDLTWARSLRAQSAAAGVAFFMKQIGSKPVVDGVPYSLLSGQKLEAHGRDVDQWPEDLRIRTWPR